MKKVFEVLKKIFVLFIAFILLVSVSVFIYHNSQLSKEPASLKVREQSLSLIIKKLMSIMREVVRIHLYLWLAPGSPLLFMT